MVIQMGLPRAETNAPPLGLRGDFLPDNIVEIGTDESGAALIEGMADLAERRFGLALCRVGRGDQRDDL